MTLFVQNGITCELIMLVVSIMMMTFIIISKPEKTLMLKMVYGGFAVSILAILSNMGLFVTTNSMAYWNAFVFYGCYVVFIVCYVVILDLIFVYMDFLSYTRRAQLSQIKMMVIAYSVIWFLVMLYPAVTGQLVVVTGNEVHLTHWYNAYVYCGIYDALLCFLTVLINKKTVSPIVFSGSMIFITADIIILVGQLFCDTAVFTSSTYVLVFMIFYILFHCSTYNEISGCQSSESFYVRIGDAIKQKKRFITVTVIFPALQKRDFYDNKELLDYGASYMCREIERTALGISIYSHNSYTYSLYCEETRTDTQDRLINKIAEIMSSPLYFKDQKIDIRYKMIIVHDSVRFTIADNVKSVIAYERTRFFPTLENEIIDVDEAELERVEEKDLIEQMLFDIRNRENLDDPRVLCFAQPIYCIGTNSFKTAEALMRLDMDGEIINPDKFIPVAEENGCIHILTLIILNKVCRFIKGIENSYDFDAITVNCSTVELDDRNLYRELEKIITDNGINPKKIRLEITESFDMSRYENVLFNMQKLNEFGVDFYLDDFGTGYANLERIVSYPFHTVKFDKNILYRALDDERADAVLDSTVKLFQENGFSTVVEGVEDEVQSEYVKEKGFGHIQGFMYSKPLSIEKLKDFFTPIETTAQ